MLIQGKYRCINCFKEMNGEHDKCVCGFDESKYDVAPHCLRPGTILNNMYCVGRVIGEGGFGITYSGFDMNLDLRLAIKEFYMNGFNSRNNTVSDELSVTYGETLQVFEANREKFVNEGKILAKFNKEDGIVTVHSFVRANNTAYLIMEFLDGQDLKAYLKSKGKLTVDEVYKIFLPIIQTLDKVHEQGLIHRDISPDNIIFTTDGKVKLLDFGAARDVTNDNKSLSVVLKHGYAPPEQYHRRGGQGPWTDVYALSATMYKCLTGKTPLEAVDRLTGSELVPVEKIVENCSSSFSDVIMKGMNLSVENRYQSMGALADALREAYESEFSYISEDNKKKNISPTKRAKSTSKNINIEKENGKTKKNRVVIISMIALLVVLLIGPLGFFWLKDGLKETAQVEEENPLADLRKGDIVTFGAYEQDGDASNGKEEIEWIAVDKKGGRLLLVSKYALDVKPFNEQSSSATWEECSLRTWLNDSFLNSAFSEEEKKKIPNSSVKAEVGTLAEVDPGNDTVDKVFLLSIPEVYEYFSSDEERRCFPTKYAKSNGAYAQAASPTAEEEKSCIWWLRSAGKSRQYGTNVEISGIVNERGDSAYLGGRAVRPALWIEIDK